MSVEERDHREYAAVVVAGFGEAEFREDAVDVFLDGSLGDPESPADAGVGASFGHQREHVAFAAGELLERIFDVACRDELLNEGGVDDRAAAANAFDGVEELV